MVYDFHTHASLRLFYFCIGRFEFFHLDETNGQLLSRYDACDSVKVREIALLSVTIGSCNIKLKNWFKKHEKRYTILVI